MGNNLSISILLKPQRILYIPMESFPILLKPWEKPSISLDMTEPTSQVWWIFTSVLPQRTLCILYSISKPKLCTILQVSFPNDECELYARRLGQGVWDDNLKLKVDKHGQVLGTLTDLAKMSACMGVISTVRFSFEILQSTWHGTCRLNLSSATALSPLDVGRGRGRWRGKERWRGEREMERGERERDGRR